MSVQAIAAKTAGTIALVTGVPGTLYLTKDYTLLYQIERDVIDQTGNLDVSGEQESNGVVTVEVKDKNSSPKWTCKVKAQLVDKDGAAITTTDSDAKTKLKNYLQKQLPTSDSTNTPSSEIRKNNKKQLVWDCSKDRKATSDTSIVSELKINIVKTTPSGGTSSYSTTLFGQSTLA